jgi:hypothetical protein
MRSDTESRPARQRAFSAHKKARKRRVPGGQRTPVASGGDWLKLSREKRALRNNTGRRAMNSPFVFFPLADCSCQVVCG